jgi:glycosyltransferase involved in cell wall biosynthesis
MDTDDWEGPGGWNDLEAYSPAQRAVFARQERWGLRHADGVTVASRALEALAWSLGVPAARVSYLPNAVESDRAGSAGSAQVAAAEVPAAAPTARSAPGILLYTRFHEFPLARPLEVLAAVRERLPGARLVVAGRGLAGEERAFLDEAARRGLAGAVEHRGWLEPADEAALFAAVDLALVPLDDSLVNRCRSSVKLLELLAAGLPVVAEAVGQAAEVIESGSSGLLVAPGDTAGLAAAVVRLWEDDALRRRVGSGGATRVRTSFAWPRRVLDLEGAYAQALAVARGT